MASFTIKESSINKSDSFAKSTLTEIPISSCSEKEGHLYLGTLTSSISTFIHLYFKGEVPNKRLDSIFLVTHSHFWVKFPHSAFEGLFQSNICKFNKGGKKSKFYSQYYKAFYSLDKRRLYIYMIGGNDLGKYEVTWVIVNDKFCTRIFDCIQ